MQNIPIVSADSLPSNHPVAKLKAMLDKVKEEPVESAPDIKTKTASTTSTAHSNKKDDVDELTTALTSLSIKPAATQIYPRTHLFGIPQELQDQIFEEVFNSGQISGADNLKPLLTCRHVYHAYHKQAWDFTVFLLIGFDFDELARIFSDAPDSIKTRKVSTIGVTAAQVQPLIQFVHELPSMHVLYIAYDGLDPGDVESKPETWYDALWRSGAFVVAEKADDVVASNDIFHDGLGTAIAKHGMIMNMTNVFSSLKIVARGDKDDEDGCEHWVVRMKVSGEIVEHKMWSDGLPVQDVYEKASASQSFVIMPNIFGMMPPSVRKALQGVLSEDIDA